MGKVRCSWSTSDPLYTEYHDKEWGVPSHADRMLFEMLLLEGAQAGLSWLTILRKRENYRQAFHRFDPEKIARYDEQDIARLMRTEGIVRNRLKIESAVKNAQGYLGVVEEYGSFDKFLWGYVEYNPIQNSWNTLEEIPTETAESKALSKDLKNRGFNFVGPTICYAFMQSVGMVNDHVTSCFRYATIQNM